MENKEATEFIIWIIEIAAREFFNNDKTRTYEYAWDMFYNSNAPSDIVDMIEEEMAV